VYFRSAFLAAVHRAQETKHLNGNDMPSTSTTDADDDEPIWDEAGPAARKMSIEHLHEQVVQVLLGKVPYSAHPNEAWAGLDYPTAFQEAILQDNPVALLNMLDREIPLHPLMLPHLADAIRAMRHNKRDGPKPLLLPLDESVIALRVGLARKKGATKSDAISELADEMGVSESTIKRAISAHNKRHASS
jgi:hypothetical protein